MRPPRAERGSVRGVRAPAGWVAVAAACGLLACSAEEAASTSGVGLPEGPSTSLPGQAGSIQPGGDLSQGAADGNSTSDSTMGDVVAPIADGAGNEIEDPVLGLEAEEEIALSFELPAAGQRYVYAANPASDTVSVIDSETLSIQSVQAGDGPTFLQSLGREDAAIVLNVNSADATLIRTEGGSSTTVNLPIVEGSNAIAIAPDGAHAVVYFNANLRLGGQPGSFQELSVIIHDEARSVPMTVGFRPSAVHFDSESRRAFVVTDDGVSVLDFDAIASRGSHIAPTFALGSASEDVSLDVSITPDGRYALARRPADAVLRLLDLEDPEAEPQTLDLTAIFAEADAALAARLAEERAAAAAAAAAAMLADAGVRDAGVRDAGAGAAEEPRDGGLVADGGLAGDAGSQADGGRPADAAIVDPSDDVVADPTPAPEPDPPPVEMEPGPPAFTDVTDVDLSPDGAFALAVIRDRRTVLRLPIPEAFDDPAAVEVITVGSELVGSVSIASDARRALLYTTAARDVERVTILDLEEDAQLTVALPKAVRAVTVAPDGRSALLMHQKADGDPAAAGLSADELIDRSYGYSVLELETGFYKLQLTPAEPGAFTVVPDSSYLFVLLNGVAGLNEVQRVGLRSFLVDTLSLGSRPVSLGVVPGANKVFVSQEHPDGRITFIDWETAKTESVTGFELNGRIRE